MNFLKELQNPPAPYFPVYAWLWNGEITKEEIDKQLEEMSECGVKAFYVLAEPKNFRPYVRRTHLTPEYLSDDYLELLDYAYKTAHDMGMYTWFYNEGGFPSGMACGQVVKSNPKLHIKKTEAKKQIMQAGEKLQIPKDCLCAFCGKNRLCDGTVFDTRTEVTFYYVTVSEDINSDIADADTFREFARITYDKVLEKTENVITSDMNYAFDDESMMKSWTADLDKKFYEKYGYDMLDYMPLITTKPRNRDEKQYPFHSYLIPSEKHEYRACSDYFMLCGELSEKNYFEPHKKWLNKHGMQFIGHLNNDNLAYGCVISRYGNMLKAMRCFDVPGIDMIWRQITYKKDGKCCYEGSEFFPRLAYSAAHQTGKNKALSESFAVCSSAVTPDEMRYDINYQAVRGINVFNFMAISYTRTGAMPLQFRPNFIKEHTVTNTLSEINGYTARLSCILQNMKPEIKTALYYPFRTICACGDVLENAVKSFEKLGDYLEKEGVSFDLIDEDFVLSSKLSDGTLEGKYVRYDNVFTPDITDYELPEVMSVLSQTNKNIVPCVKRTNPDLLTQKLCGDNCTAYFIFNSGDETKNQEIVFDEYAVPYEIDLKTGDIIQLEKSNTLTLSFLKGEGKMILFTANTVDAITPPSIEEYCELKDFNSYVSRRLYLDENGVKNEYYTDGEQKSGLYQWDKSFSGEVTYKTVLPPDMEKSDVLLDLGKVNDCAEVFVNGAYVKSVTFPPYKLRLNGVSGGDEITVKVSNTMANACADAEFFKTAPMHDVGTYNEKMQPHEKSAHCGGLFGPVKVYLYNK